MDKKIVVCYVNVAGFPDEEALSLLDELSKKLATIDPDIVNYIVPIRSGETRIECINPDLLTGEAYVEATEAVEKLKEAVKNMLKNE